MNGFFQPLQASMVAYQKKLSQNNAVCDKTNQMFLELNLNILAYLSSADAAKLDIMGEYNIMTMGKEFAAVLASGKTGEKAQAVLLMFFLRLAEEMSIKYGTIENASLKKLHTVMTAKGYKYPDYIRAQRNFALERLSVLIRRNEELK
ncbi:MAG: hypothetical protein DSZ03_01715 [Sulfurimonas sp.]|nr:MAG: hypothetical protein DSZ03_01715 [Sulfurimonas sp.]